jgi:uncharacterized membrane protein
LHFYPHPNLVLLVLALGLGLLAFVLRFVLVDFVFERLGLSRWTAVLLLWASLLGSAVNIPIARLPTEYIQRDVSVWAYGVAYVVPDVVEPHTTILAINIGGAVIPVLLAGYLLIRYGAPWRLLVAFTVVTAVAHQLAYPIRGVGIAMPPLVVSLAAALVALGLDPWGAPRTAFIAGTLGTLVGADLLNLENLKTAGASVVSIGGAGTFDGVFVTGIVAVLLAALPFGRRKAPPERPASEAHGHEP